MMDRHEEPVPSRNLDRVRNIDKVRNIDIDGQIEME